MSLVTFSFPTTTLFGSGALSDLPTRLAQLAIERPMVVTDSGLLGGSAFQCLRRVLGEKDQENRWFLFSGVHPNPVESDVRQAAELARQNNCDGVIGFGGGSPL